MTTPKRREVKFTILLFIIFWALNLCIYRGILHDGYIINGDFTRGGSLASLLNNYLVTWNGKGSFSNIVVISKLFIYLPLVPLYLLRMPISVSKIYLIYFTTFGAFSGVFTYLLSSYILKKTINITLSKEIKLILISSSIMFMFSTYVVEQVNHPTIKYAFYLSPAILLFTLRWIDEQKTRYLVLMILLWSLAISDMHWIIFGWVLIALYLLVHITMEISLKKPIKSIFANILKNGIYIVALFLLLNAYWILPGALAGGTSLYGNVLTWNGIRTLYHNANPINIFSMKGSFNMDINYGKPIFKFLTVVNPNVFLILLFVLGVSTLLLLRKKKHVLFLGTLLVVSIFLSGGPYVLAPIFRLFLFYAPFHHIYAWAFRTPKFHEVIVLTLAPLVAVIGVKIYLYIRKFKSWFPIIYITIVLILSLIPNYPLITGDFNGNLRTVNLPREYRSAISFLTSNTTGSYRIVWGPPYAGLNSTWHKNKIGDLELWISPKPILNNPRFNDYLNYPVIFGIRFPYNSMMYNGKINNVKGFYSPVSVKYIVIHNDIPSLNKKINTIIKYMNKQDGVKKVFQQGFMTIYSIEDPAPIISIKPINVILTDGLTEYNSIIQKGIANPLHFNAIYLDTLQVSNVRRIFDNSKIIITKDPSQILPVYFPNALLISPAKYVTEYSPYQTWSKASITSVPFRNIVVQEDIPIPYQFGYGFPVAFTITSHTSLNQPILKLHFTIKKSGEYKMFIRYFENPKGGNITLQLDNASDITVQTKSQITKFTWKDLGEFNLIKGTHEIKIKNIFGFNAVNLIVIIPKKEYLSSEKGLKTVLDSKTLVYPLEAETDMNRKNCKVIQEFTASNGRVVALISPKSKLWIPIHILKNSTYKLAAKGTGQIRVTVGNNTFTLNLQGNNKYQYSPLLNLTDGTYNLTITPVFSDINLLKNPSFENGKSNWTIKTHTFTVTIDNSTSYTGNYSLKVLTIVRRKGTWSGINSQIIPVQPNQTYLIITHMKTQNTNASHIAIIGYFKNTGKWRQLTQCPGGGKGTGTSNWREFQCKIKIPENVTKIRVVLNAGWVLDPKKGPAITWFDDIQVYNIDDLPKLDVVWLYSTNKNNETLNDLFKTNETPATVQNYRKINPTLWKVEVNATKPFFLTFAESYDPLWEARVYKDGKLVERVHPVPVYGVINGFWINQTGNLEIVLRYTPQDWFERGLIISLTTFIMSILYLFYDWRREKGDRWAKRLEKKIKDITTSLKSRIRGVLRR